MTIILKNYLKELINLNKNVKEFLGLTKFPEILWVNPGEQKTFGFAEIQEKLALKNCRPESFFKRKSRVCWNLQRTKINSRKFEIFSKKSRVCWTRIIVWIDFPKCTGKNTTKNRLTKNQGNFGFHKYYGNSKQGREGLT